MNKAPGQKAFEIFHGAPSDADIDIDGVWMRLSEKDADRWARVERDIRASAYRVIGEICEVAAKRSETGT